MSDRVIDRPGGPATARRAERVRRLAVTTVFAMLGVSEGTWAARIPAIKAGLHLSPGLLGLALLGPAVGCVLAMPATGAVLASVPPRRVAQAGLLLLAVMLPVTTVTGSAWQLFLVLLGWGAGIGTLDVAMNTEAAAVQDQLGRRVMSGFHGAYSVGGLAGSGLGAITAATGLSARTAFLIAGIPIVVAGMAGTQAFASRPAHHASGQPGRAARWPKWSWALVALGAISFASFLGEGAAGNWSAVYLHSSLGASAGVAAVGYSVFAVTMTAGRPAGTGSPTGSARSAWSGWRAAWPRPASAARCSSATCGRRWRASPCSGRACRWSCRWPSPPPPGWAGRARAWP